MDESKGQMTMDSETIARIRDELKSAQTSFKRDAMVLKTHADQLAAAKKAQIKLAQQTKIQLKQLEETKIQLNVKKQEISREQRMLTDLEQRIARRGGLRS